MLESRQYFAIPFGTAQKRYTLHVSMVNMLNKTPISRQNTEWTNTSMSFTGAASMHLLIWAFRERINCKFNKCSVFQQLVQNKDQPVIPVHLLLNCLCIIYQHYSLGLIGLVFLHWAVYPSTVLDWQQRTTWYFTADESHRRSLCGLKLDSEWSGISHAAH